MSIMFGSFALYSRLHVLALTCAAVSSFITYPDGARVSNPATSTVTKEQNGAEDSFLRRLYAPYSRHRPSPTAPLSTETQLRAGSDSETETSGDFMENPSVIDHPSKPILFTRGSFSSNQRGPDNGEYRGRVTKVRRGHGVGGERPTRAIYAGQPQQGAWQSKGNYQNSAQTGNYYSPYSGIIRKSSPKEGESPLHQRFSQIWDREYTKNEAKAPRMDPPVAGEDKSTAGKSFYSSRFSSQNGARWSPPAQRAHYSAHDETNVLPAVPAWSTSSGIQSSKFPSVSSHPAPRETSISKSSEAPVIKRNPRPEKLRSSITEGSGETPGHKKAQSYLFKDSQASLNAATSNERGALRVSNAATMPQIAAGVQVYSRLNFQPGEETSRRDDAPYRDASVPRYVGQTGGFTKYQPVTGLFPPLHAATQPPTRLSLRPVTAKSKDVQSFVPTPRSWDASSSVKSVPGGRVNATTRRSMQDSKQGRSTKSIYGFRGFKNPPWQAVKEPSASKKSSPPFRFDKGRDYTFKIANRFPSLSQKYSFGRRGAPTATAAPADLERAPKVYASPPGGNQITIVPTPRSFTSGLKLPERDAGTSRSLKQKPRTTAYKRIYGLKGFNTRPLEGAKTSEADASAALQQGVKLMSVQTWQPRRIHTPDDREGETKPDSKDLSAVSQSEASSEDLQRPLKTAGRSPQLTTFTPDYTFYGFLHNNNRTAHAHNKKQWKFSQKNPGILSSAHLRSTGSSKAAPTSEPGTTRKLAAARATLLSSSISGTVKGRRVKANHTGGKNLWSTQGNGTGNAAIVRLPKRPVRVEAVTYSDILGSASFSGVAATNQTQVTSAGEVYFPNRTATTKINGSLDNWSLNPDDGAHGVGNTSLKGDFSGVKEDKLRKSEDDEMKTSDLFLDNEGSGAFNASDAFSSVARPQDAGEDLSELEYLRISAGNVSFKSVRRPHPDKTADES